MTGNFMKKKLKGNSAHHQTESYALQYCEKNCKGHQNGEAELSCL